MEGLICKKCKQTSYVSPSAQHIRCFECKTVQSVGNTSDANFVENHSRMPTSQRQNHSFGAEIVYSVDQLQSYSTNYPVNYSRMPPNVQHKGCFGREKNYSAGNSSDANDMVCYRRTKDWYLEFAKKKIEAKFLCRSLRKRFSFINALQSQTGMPPHAISMSDQPPSGRRALLCGVSYKKQKHELKGVAQDIKNINKLLLEHYHFSAESILILAEEESYNLPTRKNMEDAFRWLMKGIQPGDSLVFYYSGHGKRQRDYNRDEIDGFDETICPMDFEKNGMIMDDYINETIVRPLISDVTLHAIIDSCHSGTILDLPRVYDITTGKWEDNNPPSGAYKGTGGGKAICFSACQDYQLAADTSVFSSGKEITGAMTMTFINAVKAPLAKNENITYRGIMDSMHQSIKDASKPGGFFAGIRRSFHHRILQVLIFFIKMFLYPTSKVTSESFLAIRLVFQYIGKMSILTEISFYLWNTTRFAANIMHNTKRLKTKNLGLFFYQFG